jgi:predicted nucleic acid-binding protein
MAFTVIYDACVLYPAPLRDLLIRLASKGLVRARWTDRILDESFRNILANRPDLVPGSLDRTRELMNRALRDVLVTGHEGLIEGLSLPDPDDRHVLAAAIRAGAQVIVTMNLDDFPESALAPFSVEALHPDDFVIHQIDLAPGLVCSVIAEQAAALKNPRRTVGEVLDSLRGCGLIRSVARLRELFGP